MQDRFAHFSPSLTSPASDGFDIIPHDTTPLAEVTRAIYVGAAGDLSLKMASGRVVLLKAVAAGTLLPIRVAGVRVTGTTASALVGLI